MIIRFSFPTLNHLNVTEFLRQAYDLRARADYSPLLMDGWQYKAAFVIQFRPETDINEGRFEGRVEHGISYKGGTS